MRMRLFLNLLMAIWPLADQAAGQTAPPFGPSPVIQGLELDWSTHRRLAPGSDNWPMTWGDDGHQYTAWGDGGGFGGTNRDGRVSLGVARIEGDATNYTGKNRWGGVSSERPATFEGKTYGVLCTGETLVMWLVPQPGPHDQECRLVFSVDHGLSWAKADWAFQFEDGLSIPTFLNFGRDYSGARDEFIYSYFVEPRPRPSKPEGGQVMFAVAKPGRISLSRVPKSQLSSRAAHEFFAGLDERGSPRWTRDVREKRPVFTDPNGSGWNTSVSYHPGLRRYLLATEHGASHEGKFGLFDAPEPWGPWTTVVYEEAWGDGQIEASTFFWSFPTKWFDAGDGAKFVLVFTGKNTNDSWNSVGGRFLLR